MQNKLAYIIITYNGQEYISKLLKSMPSLNDVYVFDNGSSDNTKEIVKGFNCNLIENKSNLGYGGGINHAIKELSGEYEYFCVLNQDISFKEFNIKDEDLEKYDILQPLILLPNGNINVDMLNMNVFGFVYPKSFNKKVENRKTKLMPFFSGAAFIINKKTFQEIGDFDESLFMYYEDVDYAIRCLLKSKKIAYYPNCIVEHAYKNSYKNKSKKASLYKNRKRIINKYFTDIWRRLLFVPILKEDMISRTENDKKLFTRNIKKHLSLGFYTRQIPIYTRCIVNLVMIPYSFLIKLFI